MTRAVRAKAFIVILLAAPVLAHLALLRASLAPLAFALLVLQAACLTWAAMGLVSTPTRLRALAVALVITGMILVWRLAPAGLVAASAIPHAISYAGLLAFFLLSLASGREPAITAAARRIRGPLSPVLQRYTRHVTIAWCGFFLAQLVASATFGLLVATAAIPPATWSQFLNLWNMPLVIAMFAAEFAVRRVRMANEAPSRLIDALRATRRVAPSGRATGRVAPSGRATGHVAPAAGHEP